MAEAQEDDRDHQARMKDLLKAKKVVESFQAESIRQALLSREHSVMQLQMRGPSRLHMHGPIAAGLASRTSSFRSANRSEREVGAVAGASRKGNAGVAALMDSGQQYFLYLDSSVSCPPFASFPLSLHIYQLSLDGLDYTSGVEE